MKRKLTREPQRLPPRQLPRVSAVRLIAAITEVAIGDGCPEADILEFGLSWTLDPKAGEVLVRVTDSDGLSLYSSFISTDDVQELLDEPPPLDTDDLE